MRISGTGMARVSQHCRSAESKSILTKFLIGNLGKGKRLRFLYYSNTYGNIRIVSDISD